MGEGITDGAVGKECFAGTEHIATVVIRVLLAKSEAGI